MVSTETRPSQTIFFLKFSSIASRRFLFLSSVGAFIHVADIKAPAPGSCTVPGLGRFALRYSDISQNLIMNCDLA